MHTCPECGSACYCGGDIDDIELDGGQDACLHYTQCETEENEVDWPEGSE